MNRAKELNRKLEAIAGRDAKPPQVELSCRYVELGEDFVAIKDKGGEEIVRWVRDEWVEDPDVVIPIVNAVQMACIDPDLVKERIR